MTSPSDPPGNGKAPDVEIDDEEFVEEKCSFCGRLMFDVERLIVQGGARICNHCIKEFHARLNPKPEE
jgi:ClpX C4-type zinc finger protein